MTRRCLTCRDFIDFLDDYLCGEQDSAVRTEFESHLTVCPPCRDYLRTYRDTVSLGRCTCAGETAPLPENVPEDLVRAILAARARGQ